jgi:Alginate export
MVKILRFRLLWELSIFVALFFGIDHSSGQEATPAPSPSPSPSPPPITPMRQIEDYGYLSDANQRTGAWWENLKYVRLWDTAQAPFLTVGGEVRARYEWIDNTNFGSGPQDTGGYLLTRYLPYISLTVPNLPEGIHLLIFGQFEIAHNDYDARGPAPIDQDDFDVLQAFANVAVPMGDGEFSLQFGRQMISFGTERLLGTRYGPNIPLSFDGGIARWQSDTWDIHAFYLRPVPINPDPLDNVSTTDQQLWGLYATRALKDWLPLLSGAFLDIYYIGFHDVAATYNSGTGRELRHTVGTRFFGTQNIGPGLLDWNYEGILQFGSFDSQRGDGSILAWSIGTETGYTFDMPLTPRVSVRANVISGDQNANDANLQTFNPLFPKGKYFGELTPVGPSNLINVLGTVSVSVTKNMSFSVQGGPYWRYSAHDAVYGLGGNIVRSSDSGPGDTSNAQFIGTQLEFVTTWQPVRELAFLVSYSQFQPGAFIKATGPAETIHFFAFEAVVQF